MSERTVPNALIIGPQKAGTSWLQKYFEWRGDVCLPHGVKETFFFDRYFAKGVRWYARHFAGRTAGHKIAVEVGPTYLEHPEAPRRVLDTLGQIRVVCTLRDPAARTWSLYRHMLRYGQTSLPFRQAVEEQKLYCGSCYHARIAEWENALGKDNVGIVFMEDLEVDPNGFAEEVCTRLGIEPRPVPDELRKKVFEGGSAVNATVARITNTTAQFLRSLQLYWLVNAIRDTGLKDRIFGGPAQNQPDASLSTEDRQWLIETFFQEDTLQLEAKLERDLSAWRSV